MPWETPVARMGAYQEFCKKVERLPEYLPKPVYDPPMTYYNNNKAATICIVPYDLFFNFQEGFDPKAARDDRRSLLPMFENIFKEEENKYIPVTSQFLYGRPLLHKKPLDTTVRYGKASPIKDFYREQGINVSTELEDQPTH